MLESILDFMERLIVDFSWQRLIFLVLFLALVFVGFGVFERYTSYFALSKLEKQLTLLSKASDLSSKTEHWNDEQRRAFEEVSKKLESEVSNRKTIAIVSDDWLKALAAAAPWLLMLVFFGAKKELTANMALGLLVMAFPFVFGAYLMPMFNFPWINYVLYPAGHFLIVVLVILVWQKAKQRDASTS